jgi:peptide chain release factor 1
MSNDRFASAHEMVREYQELEKQMADPSIHEDQGKARQLGRRYAQLGPVVAGFNAWKSAADDLEAAREMAQEDESFASEIPAMEASVEAAADKLEELLLPRDPNDDRDVIIEVKAGAGGDESALFAGDLVRMYQRYAEKRNWKVEIIDMTESDLGGYKDISMAIKSKGTPEPGTTPYARLKFEGGVHRVQRVPETESQGRIHTSAAGVLVLPEAEEVDVELNMNDVRVDVYRSSGPGGQSVNTTDSAVRLTHVPTGIVVSCQNEKSQLQNKESALRILRARLLADAQEKAEAAAMAERKSQVRTVDRSERIRTYNYPENRLSDHRVNYKSNNLDSVLNGELDDVVQALAVGGAERLIDDADQALVDAQAVLAHRDHSHVQRGVDQGDARQRRPRRGLQRQRVALGRAHRDAQAQGSRQGGAQAACWAMPGGYRHRVRSGSCRPECCSRGPAPSARAPADDRRDSSPC